MGCDDGPLVEGVDGAEKRGDRGDESQTRWRMIADEWISLVCAGLLLLPGRPLSSPSLHLRRANKAHAHHPLERTSEQASGTMTD